MSQVMVCKETGKHVARVEYMFVKDGKVTRGRPAHTPEAFRSRLMEARKDSKGRYNASKGKRTYVAQVKHYVDGTRSAPERIADPR